MNKTRFSEEQIITVPCEQDSGMGTRAPMLLAFGTKPLFDR